MTQLLPFHAKEDKLLQYDPRGFVVPSEYRRVSDKGKRGLSERLSSRVRHCRKLPHGRRYYQKERCLQGYMQVFTFKKTIRYYE